MVVYMLEKEKDGGDQIEIQGTSYENVRTGKNYGISKGVFDGYL